MRCELCEVGQLQKNGNDYVCQKCGAFYSADYIDKKGRLQDREVSIPVGKVPQNRPAYVPPNYDPFQRRMVLFYSPNGSGIEALRIWKQLTPYTGYPNNDELSQRANLLKAAEMEIACNPWMEMEPIARCEEEALEFGLGYARSYYDGRTDEKELLTALKNGKISVNSSFSLKSRETKDIEVKGCLLIMAIGKKHWDVVRYLLSHNCDVNVEDFSIVSNGMIVFSTPLSAAIGVQNVEIMDMLVKKGADIHHKIKIGPTEESLMTYAAVFGSPQCVKYLLYAGMDPDETSYFGYTANPLFTALSEHKYDNAKALIDAGANVDYVIYTDEADYTSLNWAIMYNDMQSFDMLLAAHANPNCVRVAHIDGSSNPALFDAVWKKQHVMVKKLIFAGADVNCYQERKDGDHFTLLDQARSNLDTEIIPFLTSHGATDNTMSSDPVTRLQGKEPPKGIELVSFYGQMHKQPENTTCYKVMVGPDKNSLDVEIEFYLTTEEERLLKEYAHGSYLLDEPPLKSIYKKAFDAVIQQTIRNYEMIGRIVDESSVRDSFIRSGIVIGIPHR